MACSKQLGYLDRAVRLVLVLSSASMLGAGEPADERSRWRLDESTGVLRLASTGLTFPPRIRSLVRVDHRFGGNPYSEAAASVSYREFGRSSLLITLLPVESKSSEVAAKLLEARKLLFLGEHPEAIGVEGSGAAVACSKTGARHRYAAFDVAYGRESLYATSLGGHVVYVRATDLRRNDYEVPDSALAALVAEMGWPCR